MAPPFFVTGLIVGFVRAVPIGPIGFLCIRTTLTEVHSSCCSRWPLSSTREHYGKHH